VYVATGTVYTVVSVVAGIAATPNLPDDIFISPLSC
jgi:hypothetical protein